MTSRAPGQVATPDSLLTARQLALATDEELSHTIAAILAAQHERAMAGGDIDALLEQAFADGFDRKGEAIPPWIAGGLLFCPGSRKDRSATSHDCVFVSIDDTWVWDYAEVFKDEMRQVPGPRSHQQSITIVPAIEGSKIDMVYSSSRSGAPCQMQKARSYQVRTGELFQVTTRSRPKNGHR